MSVVPSNKGELGVLNITIYFPRAIAIADTAIQIPTLEAANTRKTHVQKSNVHGYSKRSV